MAKTTEQTSPTAQDMLLHFEIAQFLYDEAAMLSERRYNEWVELFTDDAVYEAPIRVTRERGAAWEVSPTGRLFDDTKQTLQVRIARLNTEYAWAEDPPSRVRYHLSNIRVRPSDHPETYIVSYNVLIYRSRGELPEYELLSTQRTDLLRKTEAGWRIARRTIVVDQSVLLVRNLSYFL
jgi:3-phenylpropionate/cinnamic acid dioxygenase small subunit